MRTTRILATLIAGLCIVTLLPFAGAMSVPMDPVVQVQVTPLAGSPMMMTAVSANDNYPISVEQAKDAVRLFMSDLSLEPVLVSTGSLEIGNYYNFEAGSDTFSVNQNTGIVEFAHFGGNEKNSGTVELSRDRADAFAQAFAGKRFDGFSGRTWKLVVDRVDEDYDWVYNETSQQHERIDKKAYDFVFREEKDHVLLPNLIYVRVNAKTGDIIDYWGVERLVTVGLKNSVLLSDATQAAESYFGLIDSFTIRSSEGYLAVVTRAQNVENLAWVIKLKGYWSWDRDNESTYTIVIDAVDGRVLGTGWSNIWPESRLIDLIT